MFDLEDAFFVVSVVTRTGFSFRNDCGVGLDNRMVVLNNRDRFFSGNGCFNERPIDDIENYE
jgi:hypothetical protein